MAEFWHKTCQNRHFSRHFVTAMIFLILFFDQYWPFKKCLRFIFRAFLRKLDFKHMFRAYIPNFLAWPFLPVDLRWPWPVLWSQSTGNDTNARDIIHADSLALFALNIEILLANVTKSEMSNIPTLTWPVTSSVISRLIFSSWLESLRTGLLNFVNTYIGPVVWEITGRDDTAPNRMCDLPEPNGARAKSWL